MSILCSIVGASFTVAAAAEVIRSKKGITALGNAQVDTAQSKFGGASALFDGTGDYLTVGNTVDADMALTGNNWTVEYWARINAHAGQFQFTIGIWDSVSPNGSVWYATTNAYNGTNKMGFSYIYGTNSLSGDLSFGSALATGTWQHHAFVRNGNTLTAYLDGVSQGTHDMTGRTIDITGYNSSTNTTMKMTIGAMTGASGAYNGHLDEIRISNSARYTTTFTPSTTAFVNDANTLLLIHANGTDASTFFDDDNGVRAQQGIIANVNAQVDTAQSKFGGSSLYVNSYTAGNGSSLYIPDIKDQVKWGTTGKSFTAECWARWTQFPNPGLASTGEGAFPLINLCRNTQGYIKWCFGVNDQGYLGTDYTLSWSSFGGKTQYDTSAALSLNTWYHIAFVWDEVADSIRIYRDGVLKLNITNPLEGYTLNWAGEGSGAAPFGVFIGAHYWGQEVHIDDLRFSDSARYTTSNFTAPTQPFVNDSNTLLLIHADGTDGSTVFSDDNGARNQVGLFSTGGALISTTQSKFGGSSMYFDGTNDLVRSGVDNSLALNTGSWTIEGWIYTSDDLCELINYQDYNTNNGWAFGLRSSGRLLFVSNDGSSGLSVILSSNNAYTNNTWTHFAVVYNGSTLTLYANGTSVGSSSWVSPDLASVDGLRIGAGYGNSSGLFVDGLYYYVGYLDEVRISNTARYTAGFSVATAPFQNDANTVLLMHGDGTNNSTVFTDDNGTRPV